MLYAEERGGDESAQNLETVEQKSGDLQGNPQQGTQTPGSNGCIDLVTGVTTGDPLRCAPGGEEALPLP